MMQGHNRPPFAPTIPGTNLRSHDVPTAIIYRPARAAATSAPRSRKNSPRSPPGQFFTTLRVSPGGGAQRLARATGPQTAEDA